MSFDFGEVLTRAWEITWGHKILWAFGVVGMLLGFLFLPITFAPALSVLMAEDIPVWIEEPGYIIGYIFLFLFWLAASFLLGALLQASVSCGVLQAERGAEKLSFMEVLKSGLPFFGRFLGIAALVAGGVMVVMVGFAALYLFVSLVTFGLGAMCLAPLQILLYPLMVVVYAWQEQAMASIVVEDQGVRAAARQGWQVLRQNLLPVGLMTLILYLGVGMLSGFVSFPLMVPFFAMPVIAFEGLEHSRNIFLAAGLCALAWLPPLVVFQAAAMTFLKSSWLLTYLRLTRKTESLPPAAAPA